MMVVRFQMSQSKIQFHQTQKAQSQQRKLLPSSMFSPAEVFSPAHMMGTGVDPNFLLDENQSSAFPQSQLVNWQEADDTISRAMYYVRRHRRPTKRERANESQSVSKLLKHWTRLTIQNGMLYKARKDPHMNTKILQFIVPDSMKQKVLHGLHDAAGHQGQHRTLSLARQRFFWSGMGHDIMNYVRSCQRCIVGKTPEPHSRTSKHSHY